MVALAYNNLAAVALFFSFMGAVSATDHPNLRSVDPDTFVNASATVDMTDGDPSFRTLEQFLDSSQGRRLQARGHPLFDQLLQLENYIPPQGDMNTLMIRVSVRGKEPTTQTKAQLEQTYFNDNLSMKTQLTACSMGKLKVKAFDGRINNRRITNGVYETNLDTEETDVYLVVGELYYHLEQELGADWKAKSGIDAVMYCVPARGNGAFAVASHSVFVGSSCTRMTVHMHELGHSLTGGHSSKFSATGAWLQGADRSDFLSNNLNYPGAGSSAIQRCYNPGASWRIGWYNDQLRDLDVTSPSFSKWEGAIVGIADYKRRNLPVIVRLIAPTSKSHYFVGFNRAIGVNQHSNEARDLVTVHKMREFFINDSFLMASLAHNDEYIIEDFDDRGIDLKVQFYRRRTNKAWRAFVRVTKL